MNPEPRQDDLAQFAREHVDGIRAVETRGRNLAFEYIDHKQISGFDGMTREYGFAVVAINGDHRIVSVAPVADLVDQKESLEDELDEMKESQRDELRNEIKDEFDVSDERVADKGIDELEDLKETLDEVTADDDGDDEDDSDGDGQSDSQGSTTATNPPNNNNDSSESGSDLAPTSGSGQFADEYQ